MKTELKPIQIYVEERINLLKEKFAGFKLAILQVGDNRSLTGRIDQIINISKLAEIKTHIYYYGYEWTTRDLLEEMAALEGHYDKIVVMSSRECDRALPGFDAADRLPAAIFNYLMDSGLIVKGANAAIVDNDNKFCLSMASLLLDAGVTVTMCSSKTHGVYLHLFDTDFVICGKENKKSLNCYPLMMPIIDCGDSCYNATEREVIKVAEDLEALNFLENLGTRS